MFKLTVDEVPPKDENQRFLHSEELSSNILQNQKLILQQKNLKKSPSKSSSISTLLLSENEENELSSTPTATTPKPCTLTSTISPTLLITPKFQTKIFKYYSNIFIHIFIFFKVKF